MIGLLLVAVALIAIYRIFKYRSTYWKRKGICGPESSPIFGNLRHGILRSDRNAVFQINDWTKKYGKVYGIQEGWRNILIVSDVEMLQEMFLKKFECFHGRKLFPLAPDNETAHDIDLFHAEGARWKRLRVLSSPAFTNANLKNVMPTVVHSAEIMMDFLKQKAENEEYFNIHRHFQEFTLDTISRIALGQKGTCQFQNENLDKICEIFKGAPNTIFHIGAYIFPCIGSTLRKIVFTLFAYGIINNPFKELLDMLNEAVKIRKEQRAKGEREELDEFGKPRLDFIDFFLEAESEEQLDDAEFRRTGMKVTKMLSTGEIGSQCLLFLLAGFDTTANTLAFTVYNLAKNPDYQARIHVEIEEVIGSQGEIAYENLGKLRLIENAVKEASRLYPVASFASARRCMESTTIGAIPIEKGTYVQADVFAIHRDKSLWGEDANEFNPDRWEGDRTHQAAWLSFGAGPRMCVGMRLANMISRIAIVKILTKYEILPSPHVDKDFRLIGGSAIQPSSVYVQLKKRN